MFKSIAFLTILFVAVQSRPADDPSSVSIVRSESVYQPDGSYKFSYETSDGAIREESGIPKNVGQEDQFVAVTGMYKYIDADGQPIEVHYTADEHGFVPVGSNIPEAIVRAAKSASEAH
ncbi:larval cuticle protein 65Ag1-like [Condylostylus longicornis]|uniref:larval cuticle protein 65Ag1-like n=1 Tax=Condylostylus longicornis TaxID=2530218 RepID=UPI00244E210F|nr:larval cuticle protein 65Ag1-like [Condylostylus longicornis]